MEVCMKRQKLEGKAAFLASCGLKYPGGVPRCKAEEATGGMVSSKALANHDALGTGPVGAFKVRDKVVYSANSLADWLFGMEGKE
jgi:hypothetical protein